MAIISAQVTALLPTAATRWQGYNSLFQGLLEGQDDEGLNFTQVKHPTNKLASTETIDHRRIVFP